MNKLITIVVPMYNEESNISSCVNILREQVCQNFHVIFIDDGSIDNTYLVLQSTLEQLDIKFSYDILKQNNMGAAKARESAILQALTPYIMMFDCDDNISKNMIAEYVSLLSEDSSVDIIMPNLVVEDENGYNQFSFYDNERIYSGLNCVEYSLGSWKVHGVICARKNIFEQSYLVYKKYNPQENNYINNDEVITRLNFFHSKKVVRSQAIYYYQNNLNSTTKRINQNRYFMLNNAVILYQLFGKDMQQISINAQKELVSILWGCFRYLLKYKYELQNIDQWKKNIKSTLHFIWHQKSIDFTIKEHVKLCLIYITIPFI